MLNKFLTGFHDDYLFGEVLGKGSFSLVVSATHKKTRELYAVKIVKKLGISNEDLQYLKREIEILQILNEEYHKNVLKLIDVYDDPSSYNIVTELVRGGELFYKIVNKIYYTEKEARDTSKIIFEAIQHFHSLKVVHRDLKPENLLLRSPDNDSDIIVSDFGFATRFVNDNCLKTFCGTPDYVAPEIISKVPYGTKADIYSAGVIVYVLLCGQLPFPGDDYQEKGFSIRNRDVEFEYKYFYNVSEEAIDFVRKVLVKDPKKRMSVDEALNHKWFKSDGGNLREIDRSESLRNMKKNFKPGKQFKKVVKAVMAVQRLSAQAVDIVGSQCAEMNKKLHMNMSLNERKNSSLSVFDLENNSYA